MPGQLSPSSSSSQTPVLSIRGLSKTFPGQVALDDVDLVIDAGSVHALVGQNGSGKSTLIKILAGYHQPDPGAVTFADGGRLAIGDGKEAANHGIRFVHQDLGLVDSLSTVENLHLGLGYQTRRAFRIDWRTTNAAAREALSQLGFADFDVRLPVGRLQPAQKTAVAIARALQGWEQSTRLLVLDEPTASLPGADVERLFEAVRRLAENGVAVLYVSHHLDEVFAIADAVTVLRDGKRVCTEPIAALDHEQLIERIIGHKLDAPMAATSIRSAGDVLHVHGLAGATARDVNLTVGHGEIVGLAGITGSGRDSVIGLLTGQVPRDAGEVLVDDTPLENYAPKQAIRSGVAFVPADRATQGAVASMSVRANVTLSGLRRHARWGRLRHRAERDEAVQWIGRLSIKTAGDLAPMGSLSGGNQQKVLFGKGLRLAPKVFALDEPTRGIDVGAKEEIHQLVERAAASGSAVLVASTDTEELVRLCHRVLILRDGAVAESLAGAELSVERIEHAQLQATKGHS